MPDVNPFAPVIDLGGGLGATVGPVRGQGSGSVSLGSNLSPSDNHWTAALVLGAVVLLWALWQSKFRFSVTVG